MATKKQVEHLSAGMVQSAQQSGKFDAAHVMEQAVKDASVWASLGHMPASLGPEYVELRLQQLVTTLQAELEDVKEQMRMASARCVMAAGCTNPVTAMVGPHPSCAEHASPHLGSQVVEVRILK